MYGFGSKKALIEDFASEALTEHSVVVINGYLQSINIKQVHIFDFRATCYCCTYTPMKWLQDLSFELQ